MQNETIIIETEINLFKLSDYLTIKDIIYLLKIKSELFNNSNNIKNFNKISIVQNIVNDLEFSNDSIQFLIDYFTENLKYKKLNEDNR